MNHLRGELERQALLAIVAVAGWTYGEARAVLRWANRRLDALEGRP